MKSTIFLLSVLVVFVQSNPARTVETTLDLEYDYDFDYDAKYEYKSGPKPAKTVEYVLVDAPKSKPKYEIVRETDITLEYDRDATYDRNVETIIRSKRSDLCRDC